jgi:hypothetical protein
MGKISFETLKPGMKLASDVIERSGRVLLRAGTEITEKHLDILRKWGVTEVDALGVSADSPGQELEAMDPELLVEAEMKARRLFRHTDPDHPAVGELLRLCALRLARRHSGIGNHAT